MPWSVVVQRPAGVASTAPLPVDLADRWLLGAAAHLAAACGVDPSTLPALADASVMPAEPGAPEPEPFDEAALAVLLSALAVEARLNRVLRLCDPSDWRSTAHLPPVEKLGLAPRLLRAEDRTNGSAEHDAVVEAAAMLFAVRAGLGGEVELARPDAIRARSLVQTAARICSYVGMLAGDEPEDPAAAFVERVAKRLIPRARARAAAEGDAPQSEWTWSDVEFPPNLVGS